MRRLFLSAAVWATYAAVATTDSARADIHECVVKSTTPVETIDKHTGQPLAPIKKGDHVYERWLQFVPHTLAVRGKHGFEDIQGPKKDDLDCDTADTQPGYPIVFRNAEELFKAFGVVDPDGGGAKAIEKQPLVCNFKHFAHTTYLQYSAEFFAPYQKVGMPLANLCMVMTSGQVRFDPETGERLPTYVVLNRMTEQGSTTMISDERPLIIPGCFAAGILSRPRSFISDMMPLGCKVNFHPWSGRRLDEKEKEFFTRFASLKTSSESGEAQVDSKKLADDASRRASEAKIQAVRLKINSQ